MAEEKKATKPAKAGAKARKSAAATVVAKARKPAAARKVPAPAAAAPVAAPVAAPAVEAVVAAPVRTLRRKDLVERVAASSGAKKKAVREIVEATLKVLGEALAAGETLALPHFGKARVNKHRDLSSGEMLTVKLRRKPAGKTTDKGAGKAPPETAADPLAEPAE